MVAESEAVRAREVDTVRRGARQEATGGNAQAESLVANLFLEATREVDALEDEHAARPPDAEEP